MRKIVLASHGEFAKGLLHSAGMIVGDMAAGIEVYGLYPGQDARDYASELEKEAAAAPGTEYILLADLFGASVCTALSRLSNLGNVRLFSGMNLALLLLLLTDYPDPLTDADVESLMRDVRKQTREVNPSGAQSEEEDF